MRPIVVRGLSSCIIVVLIAGVALAQDSGGSMGGGSWDSGGGGGSWDSGGGGGYSSSSDSSYSGGSSWDSGSSSSGGGGNLGAGEIVVMIAFFGLFALVSFIKNNWSSSISPGIGSYSAETTRFVDVTVLRVGLDARVRPYAQKELARIAAIADTSTPQGLVTMLNEVGLMLRRLRDAWVYGGAHNLPMSPMGNAQQSFQQHVSAARGTFRHELVRNHDGTSSTTERPDIAARPSEEGAGLVLVTLVVAARQELFTVERIGDGDDLRRALEVLSALTSHSLVAAEIVWTPAAEGDRMSSVELETMLPDEVFPIRGAMVGKLVCTYCSGPFPAELLSCPHCGAPARDLAA